MSRKSYAANSVHDRNILIKIGEIVAGDDGGKFVRISELPDSVWLVKSALQVGDR